MTAPTEPSQRRYLPALRFRALTRFYDPAIRLTTREATFRRSYSSRPGSAPATGSSTSGGTGTLAVLMKRMAPGADVFGLDADTEILERARRKAAEPGVEVGFQQGFSDDLPYEDGSFDAVVSTLFSPRGQAADHRRDHSCAQTRG